MSSTYYAPFVPADPCPPEPREELIKTDEHIWPPEEVIQAEIDLAWAEHWGDPTEIADAEQQLVRVKASTHAYV